MEFHLRSTVPTIVKYAPSETVFSQFMLSPSFRIMSMKHRNTTRDQKRVQEGIESIPPNHVHSMPYQYKEGLKNQRRGAAEGHALWKTLN